MSMLPDKKLGKITMVIVALFAAIAILYFSKYRGAKQLPPQLSPSIPTTTTDQKTPDSPEIDQSQESSDVREHRIQESDRQFLIEQGLREPTNDLVKDLMKHNELIPCEGSVGGTPGFYNRDRIAVLSKDHVIADYDDGHVEGTIELSFIVSHGTISWTVVSSECGN